MLLKIIIFLAIIALKNPIRRQPYGIFMPYSNLKSNDFKCFAVLYPLNFVCKYSLKTEQDWRLARLFGFISGNFGEKPILRYRTSAKGGIYFGDNSMDYFNNSLP